MLKVLLGSALVLMILPLSLLPVAAVSGAGAAPLTATVITDEAPAITTPPRAVGAYVSSDGLAWNPLAAVGSGIPLPFAPPAVALYCSADGNSWLPCLNSGGGGGGTGSGTVNNSAQPNSVAYYPSAGTAVSGASITGIPYFSPAGAPLAATSSQLQTIIGGGVYDAVGSVIDASRVSTGVLAQAQVPAPTSAKITSALGYTPAQSPQISGNLATNVLADYNVFPGSGTVLPDTSGNGNNGTLTGGTSWIQGGVAIPQSSGVSLPTAVNSARTFAIEYYGPSLTNTPGGGSAIQNYVTLLTNSNGSQGVNILLNPPPYDASGNQIANRGYPLGGAAMWGGGIITASANLVSGVHVLVYTCGTGGGNTDHVYLDGAEVAYSVGPGACAAQSSGNLYLGSSNAGPWNGSGLYGNIYRARLYASSLSQADALSLSNVLLADLANRGIALGGGTALHPGLQIHLTADSIGAGQGGTGATWLGTLSLMNYPTYATVNWSLGGAKLYAMTASDQVRVVPYCRSYIGQTLHITSAGTNDAGDYSDAASFAAATFAYLTQNVQQDIVSGCKPFVATMISRGGSPNGNGTYDSYKNAYNALIRARWKQIGAVGLIDFNAIPQMGADGAYANTTYFSSDQIHPTDAGYVLMAAAASNALNVVSGTSESNPTIVTATTYAMAAGDTYVKASPSAAQTDTLPSCIGQTGAIYAVNNSQSAFTVTLKTNVSSQPINGIDYSATGLTVPSNSSVRLRDVANPASAGGCHWEM